MTEQDRPERAYEYHFGAPIGSEYPTINGRRIPWLIAFDEEEGIYPMVQSVAHGHAHVLWLPVYVEAPPPTPPAGSPDAEPLITGPSQEEASA